jgi:glycopeptide antibiotics resistance protein
MKNFIKNNKILLISLILLLINKLIRELDLKFILIKTVTNSIPNFLGVIIVYLIIEMYWRKHIKSKIELVLTSVIIILVWELLQSLIKGYYFDIFDIYFTIISGFLILVLKTKT